MGLALLFIWTMIGLCKKLLGHFESKLFPRRRKDLAVTAVRPRRLTGNRKPAWVIDEVLKIYFVSKSIRKTAMEFNRRHAANGQTVCGTTVYNWIQRYGSNMRTVQLATKHRVPRQQPANHCWGLDATGKKDGSGELHFIFGIIDHGTRLCVRLKRMPEQTAAALLHELLAATREFGKPTFIRTDNASVFHSREFQQGLKAAGIRHQFSAAGKPWQNGRIERLFWTLKDKLRLLVPANGEALDQLLHEFRYWYNQARPHQHLFGWTPMEVWRGESPYVRPPRKVRPYSGWEGRLTGFLHRR